MTRSDLPYVALVTIFAVAIFLAGRLSAPSPVSVPAPVALPSAPQVIVIASSSGAEPPAPAPVVEAKPSATPVVATPAPAPVRPVTPKETIRPAAPKPVPSIPVELEEDLPNPYRASSTPGF